MRFSRRRCAVLTHAIALGAVKDRLSELLDEDIYSKNARLIITKKIIEYVSKAFIESKSAKPILGFDTGTSISDLRQFHLDWQVQQKRVGTLDTLDGTLLTDLSGTLGNFLLYAAIGRVEVTGERYFNYKTKPHQYCIDPIATLTHVYIYLKDNYSFNDKDPSGSQYLGHWNKRDMILSYAEAANDLLGQVSPRMKIKMGDNNKTESTSINWGYLLRRKETDKPVDKRTGIFSKFLEKDVYWPVYNKTYNEWRERHKRGGDFMIYSKPKLYKLKTPIVINLGMVCRPYDNTSTGQ